MAKSDQLGFFDRHAEKIIVGVAALVLIAVLVLRVLSSPHSSKDVGFSTQTVTPSQMDSQLLDAAENTRNYITNRKPEQKESPDPLSQLNSNMAKPIGIDARDVVAPAAPWTIRQMKPGPVGMQKTPELEMPPTPESTLVWAGYELIQDDDSLEVGAVKEQLAAHVTTVWDYAKMIASWKDAVRESGASMRILFLSVQVERQKLLDDGSWSTPEPIALPEDMPALPDFTEDSPTDIQNSLDVFGNPGNQRAILNPAYPSVFWPMAGTWGGWMHHLPRTEVSILEIAEIWPEQKQPEPYRLRLEQQQEQARRAGKDTDNQPRRDTPAVREDTGMDTVNYPVPDGGTVSPRMTSPSPRNTAAKDQREQEQNDRKAKQMVTKAQEELVNGRAHLKNNEIDQAVSAFNRAEKLFTQAQEVASGIAGAAQGLAEAEAAKFEAKLPQPTPLPSLADMCRNGKVQIWAHDKTLEPGNTYRYRLNISLLNPIFDASMLGQPNSPKPVMTVNTPWSDNVVVDKPIKFFLTGNDNRGNAKVSIYRMNNGLLRSQKVAVKPGDVIGSAEQMDYIDPMTSRKAAEQTEVDFSTGYVVVDVDTEKPILPRGAVGLNRKTVQITLLTPEGKLITRNAVDDKGKDEYSALNRQNGKDNDYLDSAQSAY